MRNVPAEVRRLIDAERAVAAAAIDAARDLDTLADAQEALERGPVVGIRPELLANIEGITRRYRRAEQTLAKCQREMDAAAVEARKVAWADGDLGLIELLNRPALRR